MTREHVPTDGNIPYRVPMPAPATYTTRAPTMNGPDQAEARAALLREHHIDPDSVFGDSAGIYCDVFGRWSVEFDRISAPDGPPSDGFAHDEQHIVHERIAITPEIAADLLGWTA